MSDVITYSDFWPLSLIPIVLQSIAILYLWKITPIIDIRSSILYAIKNVTLLAYFIIVTLILITASEQSGEQPIEAWGLFIGFVMPIIISSCFLLHLRTMKRVLQPNTPIPNTDERNRLRDIKRDANRDVERDVDRDVPRDVRRDLYRDQGKDKADNQ